MGEFVKTRCPLLLCLATLSLACPPVTASEIDPATGLVVAPGWELAAAHCGGCHSHRLVTAQRGDDAFWRSTILWMQKTQNLWQIPADQETTLIDYLAAHYAESEWGRRPPLSPSLLTPAQ